MLYRDPEMNILYPNLRIKQLEGEREDGHRKALEDLGPDLWAAVEDDFSGYTHQRFITRYCQERLVGYYIESLFRKKESKNEPETTKKSL